MHAQSPFCSGLSVSVCTLQFFCLSCHGIINRQVIFPLYPQVYVLHIRVILTVHHAPEGIPHFLISMCQEQPSAVLILPHLIYQIVRSSAAVQKHIHIAPWFQTFEDCPFFKGQHLTLSGKLPYLFGEYAVHADGRFPQDHHSASAAGKSQKAVHRALPQRNTARNQNHLITHFPHTEALAVKCTVRLFLQKRFTDIIKIHLTEGEPSAQISVLVFQGFLLFVGLVIRSESHPEGFHGMYDTDFYLRPPACQSRIDTSEIIFDQGVFLIPG